MSILSSTSSSSHTTPTSSYSNNAPNSPPSLPPSPTAAQTTTPSPSLPPPEIIVIGGLAVDTTCTHAPLSSSPSAQPPLHTSSPAKITSSIGGVAHNIAYATHLLGARTQLITAVASDASGTWAVSELKKRGMRTEGVRVVERGDMSTAQYVSVNDQQGGLVMAMADMRIMEELLEPGYITAQLEGAIGPKTKYVCLDANLKASTTRAILEVLPSHVKVAMDPTSTPKASILSQLASSLGFFPAQSIDIITPNASELHSLSDSLSPSLMDNPSWFPILDSLSLGETFRTQCEFRFGSQGANWLVEEGHLQSAIRLLPVLPTILVKFGEKGVLAVRLLGKNDDIEMDAETVVVKARQNILGVKGLWVRYFPVTELVENVGSVSGAGDTFLGVVLAGLAKGGSLKKCIEDGMDAAAVTLKDVGGVSSEIEKLRSRLF